MKTTVGRKCMLECRLKVLRINLTNVLLYFNSGNSNLVVFICLCFIQFVSKYFVAKLNTTFFNFFSVFLILENFLNIKSMKI